MIIDHNRCILCGRCVRACAEIAGTYVLNFHNRGPKNLVGLDLHASREESTCYQLRRVPPGLSHRGDL